MEHSLHLHEEMLLLALGERTGKVEMGMWCAQALGGAVAAELLLAERIRLDGQKKPRVEIASTEPLGNEILDEWLDTIARDPRPRTVVRWVGKIADSKDLRGRVARGLVRRGILRLEESQFLLLFSRKIYPETDPEPERAIRARLHEAIFTDTAQIEPRTVALLSIANATELLPVIFDKRELKSRKHRIESVVNGEVTGAAAQNLIEEMMTAITVAVIIPAVVT